MDRSHQSVAAPGVDDMSGTISDAADSVQRSCARVTGLLRSGIEGDRRITSSTWTIRDLAGHLTSGLDAYRQVAEGQPSPYEDIDDRAKTNQARLETTSHLSLQEMADMIDEHNAHVVAALVSRRENAVVAWHGGIELSVRAVLGAIAGEYLFHGLDLARTIGAPWPIDRADTFAIVDLFNTVTPHLLDHRRVRNLTATIEVRCRGYDTSTFEFRNGVLAVTPGPASSAHVRMSVDPVAFLLLGYKRAGLTKLLVTGRAVAWGRRPDLALRFAGFFQAP
jgi:uncharacterized protein (TIGR03083 family)